MKSKIFKVLAVELLSIICLYSPSFANDVNVSTVGRETFVSVSYDMLVGGYLGWDAVARNGNNFVVPSPLIFPAYQYCPRYAICLTDPISPGSSNIQHQYDLGLLPAGDYSVAFGGISKSFSVPYIANRMPVITGSPATISTASGYSFIPAASDPDGDRLTFSIQNKPAWAFFDSGTGALSGMPKVSDVGTYNNIVIAVTDGVATNQLSPFSIAVTQGTSVPVMEGWWLVPAMLAGVGIFARRRKEY